MNERKQNILDAVGTMIAEHDRWADDQDAPDVPTQRLEFAIDAAILECAHGDVPGDCRQLVAAMELLFHEWSSYKDGRWDNRGRPLGSFWDAFRAVMLARKGASMSPKRTIEPVAELLRQKVGYEQIAVIYGRERGPFMRDGRVDVDAILRESETKGSVVSAGWVHPDEIDRQSEEIESLNGKLAALQALSPVDEVEKATIEEMLREGAFPEQIAAVKKVSLDEVRAVAEEHGITPNERPNLHATRNQFDPVLTEEQDAALQPRKQVAEESSAPDADALDSLILEEHERQPSLGAGELASVMTERLEVPVSPQKVAGVLRSRKRELQKV